MRSWAVPKGPSLDPAVKRLAVEVPDHATDDSMFEGDARIRPRDRLGPGTYEQGGRVAWPEGAQSRPRRLRAPREKLHGGFALQRTRPGAKAQWLLIKRRDDDAQPGSDIVAERPESVLSGRTLDEPLE